MRATPLLVLLGAVVVSASACVDSPELLPGGLRCRDLRTQNESIAVGLGLKLLCGLEVRHLPGVQGDSGTTGGDELVSNLCPAACGAQDHRNHDEGS